MTTRTMFKERSQSERTGQIKATFGRRKCKNALSNSHGPYFGHAKFITHKRTDTQKSAHYYQCEREQNYTLLLLTCKFDDEHNYLLTWNNLSVLL